MKIGVLTSYIINDTSYSSYVLGKSISAIKRAIKKRGLNEKIDSGVMEIPNTIPDYTILSDKEILKRKEEILHSLCFLSFIGLKCKTLQVEDVLGDEGAIHEVAHLLTNTVVEQKKSLTLIRDFANRVKKSAIGLYEPV